MLDIRLVRENPDIIRENLKRRGNSDYLGYLDRLVEADKNWREILGESEKLKAERNKLSAQIAKGGDKEAILKQTQQLKADVEKKDKAAEQFSKEVRDLLLRIPNLLHESVPFGKDSRDNIEIRKWGKPPEFSFKPKDHFTIAKKLGLIDTERASKVSGAGFYYLKNELVLLDYAIMGYALDFLMKKGFTPVEPPYMINKAAYEGVTSLDDFEDVMYKIEGQDHYLIATSEHAIGSMFKDETLLVDELPLKYCGISPCFRKEIGTHGQYTHGLYRIHQFNKVEQFVFSHPEESWKIHEELQQNTEKMFQKLGIYYRVLNLCSADVGFMMSKTYDMEIWMADGVFREVGSNSNAVDYQARRLGIKYREKQGGAPKDYVHTLNNTGLATSRVMIAVLEQFQNEDGTVNIPKPLQPYMGGIKKLE
jgi:seryl-tRNA synthetase